MNGTLPSRSRFALPILVAALPSLAAARGLVSDATMLMMLMVVILVMALVGGFREGLSWTKVSRSYLLLSASWVVLGLALLLVVPPISTGAGPERFNEGVSWLAQIVIGLTFGVALLVSATPKWGLDWLRRGWVIAYVATGCVAIWELSTGHHLSTGFIVEHGLAISTRSTVVSTFFNPNDYATFIALAFPFLVWSAWRAARLSRFVYVVLCVSALLAVVFEGSIVIILAMGVELTVVAFALVRERRVRRRKASFRVAVVLLLAMAAGANILSSAPRTAIGLNQDIRESSTQNYGSVASGGVRVNLLRDGLFFTWQGFGVGYGPGQFENLMLADKPPYSTSDGRIRIINAHNVFVEVLVDLGILGLAALVFFLWRVWRATRVQTLPTLVARMSLTGFLFAQAASSSFVRNSVFGMFLGSMLVLGVASELRATRPRVEPPRENEYVRVFTRQLHGSAV
jgi:O-antigen ligase